MARRAGALGIARPGLAAAALALAGCPRVPPPDLSTDPRELLAEVRAHQARVLRVSGSARLGLSSPSGGGSVEALVAPERPDRLRVELLDFFGGPLAALAVRDGRFVYFDARRGTWYRGAATPANLARLLPVGIAPVELVAVLCGSAPLLPGEPSEVAAGRGVLHVALVAGDRVQRLAVGAGAAVEASRIRRRTEAGEEPADYDLAFRAFRREAGVRFPGKLALDALGAGARLTLEWRDDLRVNGPPEAARFDLEPPAGARTVDLDPGDGPPPLELPGAAGESGGEPGFLRRAVGMAGDLG